MQTESNPERERSENGGCIGALKSERLAPPRSKVGLGD